MTNPGAALDFGALVDQLLSHAGQLGVFDRVLDYEPVAAPGDGITAAIWFLTAKPARGSSGLGATTVVVNCVARLYRPMLTQPQGSLETNMMTALSALMGAYSSDFDLGGLVRQIDLLGQFGPPLSSQGAYQNFEGAQYRVITVTVPVVVNDAWPQS